MIASTPQNWKAASLDAFRRNATIPERAETPSRIFEGVYPSISIDRASPTPAAKHAPFHRAALLFLKPVPLVTKAVHLRQHPAQQKLSRCSRDAGALKLQNLLTLPSDLDAHALDFGTDVI
jgi:hypothetical protein